MRLTSAVWPAARLSAAALGTGLMLLSTACAASQDDVGPEAADTADGPLQVFAAASLAETFTEIGALFEAEHGAEVHFNFAGSADLVAQIEQGAPAAVFASADEVIMDRAKDAGTAAREPRLFAANSLVIVTPPGDPAGVEALTDLAGDDVVTVVCAPQVPCGDATRKVTDNAGIELTPASEENAVTDVLGKVRSGEADAGLVYRTDALGAGNEVDTIEFDGADEVVTNYPITALDSAPDLELAEDFVDFVLSPDAQKILCEAGFSTP